jgi:transcriptional regulator with XRE-family HTH domain
MKTRDRKAVSSTLSADVIGYLRERGYKQSDVAKMLGVTEGYISLVKARERALTLDHLELLAKSVSMPLGALLLAVSAPKMKAVDAEHAKLVDLAARIVRKADEAAGAIMRGKHARA